MDNVDTHPLVSSVGIQGNGQSATNLEKMKDKLGLNDKSEVEVNISKHFTKELKEEKKEIEKQLRTKTQELEAAKEKAE